MLPTIIQAPRRDTFWLLLVAVGFGVAQTVVLPLDTPFSWDEALYASQFSGSVPAMGLAAHRALGMPLVLAPVTAITSSVTAIRAYLMVLTGVGLVLAFRPWIAVGGRAIVLAAVLFAGSEVTLVNAPQALPNVLAALAAVAALGYFLQATGSPRAPGALLGTVVAVAVLSLTRPTDAVFISVPVVVAAVAVRRWRRLVPVTAVLAGLLIGGVVWLVEAWVRFDGPFRRLTAMGQITAAGTEPVALQWCAAVVARLASAWPIMAVAIGCAVVAAAAAVLAVRRLRTAPPSPIWVLSVITAVAAVLPYYLLLSFTSNRYLLPAYGLVTPALAAALGRLTRTWSGRAGAVISCLVAVLLAAHVGVQVWTAQHRTVSVVATRQERRGYAERLGELGVAPPCVVSGSFAPQLAYALDCSAGDIQSAVGDDTTEAAANRRDQLTARNEHARFVVVRSSSRRPPWLAGWTRVHLVPDSSVYAYFRQPVA